MDAPITAWVYSELMAADNMLESAGYFCLHTENGVAQLSV